MMATSIQVTFDCADPDRLASFWAEALGYRNQDPPEGYTTWPAYLAAQGIPEDQWNAASAIVDPEGRGPRLYFQRVPEAKVVKNRVHLDLNVGGGGHVTLEERRERVNAAVERLRGVGATQLRPVEEHGE